MQAAFAILVMGPKFHWSNQEELVMAASQETLMSRCPNNRIGEPLTKQAVASLWVAHPCMGGLLHLHAPHPPTHPKDATAPHGRCMGGLPRRHGSLPSAPYFHGKGPHATTSQWHHLQKTTLGSDGKALCTYCHLISIFPYWCRPSKTCKENKNEPLRDSSLLAWQPIRNEITDRNFEVIQPKSISDAAPQILAGIHTFKKTRWIPRALLQDFLKNKSLYI